MVIYLTTNIINGKKYIGKDTKNSPSYIGSGVLLKKAISKYGKVNFKKEIIDSASTIEELDQKEKYWIKKHNAVSDDNYYNIATGGTGGNLGELVIKKISNALLGHKHSNETRKKIAKKALGRKVGEHTKQKMSISQRAINKDWLLNYSKGVENPRAKPVYQYDLEGVLVRKWDYARQAIKELGMSQSDISNCINGNQKTAKGFIWKNT